MRYISGIAFRVVEVGMSIEKKDAAAVPPYVAYKTLKNFFRSLGQGMPDRIDKSVMPSMSGGVQAQLISALKYLGLITQAGMPSGNLHHLAKPDSAEFQKALRETLEESYPFLKSKEINLASATMHQLSDKFSQLASGDTARKCMTFFIPAAKDAGIVLSPYIKEPGKRSSSNGKSKKIRPNSPKNAAPAVAEQPQMVQKESVGQNHGQTWVELLLAKFPAFDPSWPDEIKKNWFSGFNDLMQQGKDAKP